METDEQKEARLPMWPDVDRHTIYLFGNVAERSSDLASSPFITICHRLSPLITFITYHQHQTLVVSHMSQGNSCKLPRIGRRIYTAMQLFPRR